jgi:hypothetical protein
MLLSVKSTPLPNFHKFISFLFSIPCSNAYVESVFSTMKHLCDDKRISLQHYADKSQNFDKFFDGLWWEHCLKTSIPQLKSFAFEFVFGYPHKALTVDEAKIILLPFQRDFWLKEKR